MSCEKSDAVENFFGDPDLDPPVSPVVEKLLPYLDSASALHLLQSGITCLLKHLQYSPVVWRKLVRRTLPGDYEIGVDQLYYHKYNDRVRESFEEKQIQMASLINILKMLDEPKPHILHLLEVICERTRADMGGQYIQIGSQGSSYSVTPLGFLLLEEVEAAFGSALQEVLAIGSRLEEPWLAALASRVLRQKQKVTKMEIGLMNLTTKESCNALQILVMNSVTEGRESVGRLKVSGSNIEVEGWAAIAKALSLAPKWVKFVVAPVDLMQQGRREDLRRVWDCLDSGYYNGWRVGDGDEDGDKIFFNRVHGWGSLEQLLNKN